MPCPTTTTSRSTRTFRFVPAPSRKSARVRGETELHLFVTHTHRDHSPTTARIKHATGATVYAEGPHRASRPRFESEKISSESGADRDFRPDLARSEERRVGKECR